MEREPLFDLGTLWSRPPRWLAQKKTTERDRVSIPSRLNRPRRTRTNSGWQVCRPMSSYGTTGGDKIWTITEADRSHTSLLFPKSTDDKM